MGTGTTGQEEFAELLLQLRLQLEQGLDATTHAEAPVDLEEPIGRLSRMDAIQQKKMMAAGRQNLMVRLSQVKRALQALEDGTYGDCLSCEEPISEKRLRARPETPLCIECQRENERR